MPRPGHRRVHRTVQPSPNSFFPSRASRGFTLLEVLLSLAIIALLATVLIGGSAQLLNDKPVSADEVFWKCVQEARKAALKTERDTRLTFDAKEKKFVISDGGAAKDFPIPARSAAELTVDFLTMQKGASSILIGGVLIETQTVPFVTFYSDGTCSAFRAQFMRNGASHVLSVDPWTCAPMLTPPDPNAPPVF